MDKIMQYAAHWIIGIAAFAVWAFGKNWGMDASIISYAAWTLPTVVGHAIAVSSMSNSGTNVPAVGTNEPAVITPPAP